MEREIADLRKRLSNGEHAENHDGDELSRSSEEVFPEGDNRGQPLPTPVDPQLALAPPMTAIPRQPILPHDDQLWKLEDVTLSRGRVLRLFEQ